jgi:hypothetical protein
MRRWLLLGTLTKLLIALGSEFVLIHGGFRLLCLWNCLVAGRNGCDASRKEESAEGEKEEKWNLNGE